MTYLARAASRAAAYERSLPSEAAARLAHNLALARTVGELMAERPDLAYSEARAIVESGAPVEASLLARGLAHAVPAGAAFWIAIAFTLRTLL